MAGAAAHGPRLPLLLKGAAGMLLLVDADRLVLDGL